HVLGDEVQRPPLASRVDREGRVRIADPHRAEKQGGESLERTGWATSSSESSGCPNQTNQFKRFQTSFQGLPMPIRVIVSPSTLMVNLPGFPMRLLVLGLAYSVV